MTIEPAIVSRLHIAKDRPLHAVDVTDIEMKSIVWLDRPHLQASAFHLIAGPKGVGKGTWLARVAAHMTRGLYGEPRSVLIVSSEDSASIDLKPRLVAAEADTGRIKLVVDPFVLPADLDRLRDLARDVGNVGLIIIDPVGNHLGGVNTDQEGAIRHAIGGLNQLADDIDCAILGVRHFGKSRQNGALSAVLGSTAWVDLPRAVLAFARDDEDDMAFHVQVVAGNRSGRGSGRAFRIELRQVGLDEPVTYAVEVGESHKDVDDLLSAPRATSRSQSARDLIVEILEAEGPQESNTLDNRVAEETGVSAKTARNQRGELKNQDLIKAVPDKDEHGEITRWMVMRTSTPAPDKWREMTQCPAHEYTGSGRVLEENPGLWRPVPDSQHTRDLALSSREDTDE